MTTETKHYEMLSTQKGVRSGEIHPVVFQEGKTYAIDDSLKSQFEALDAIKPSTAQPEEPSPHGPQGSPDNWLAKDPINENVLDENPAVLRHAEIPVEAVIAQNDAAQANGDMTPEAEAALGREHPEATVPAEEPAKAKPGKKHK